MQICALCCHLVSKVNKFILCFVERCPKWRNKWHLYSNDETETQSSAWRNVVGNTVEFRFFSFHDDCWSHGPPTAVLHKGGSFQPQTWWYRHCWQEFVLHLLWPHHVWKSCSSAVQRRRDEMFSWLNPARILKSRQVFIYLFLSELLTF